jgi:hypothetical protein
MALTGTSSVRKPLRISEEEIDASNGSYKGIEI